MLFLFCLFTTKNEVLKLQAELHICYPDMRESVNFLIKQIQQESK